MVFFLRFTEARNHREIRQASAIARHTRDLSNDEFRSLHPFTQSHSCNLIHHI